MKTNIKKLTKKELEREYESINEVIELGCFGTRDLIYRDLLEREIDKRGFEILKSVKVRLS